MRIQQCLALGLLIGGAALVASAPRHAAAQYGGQPSREIFTAPQDATRVKPASAQTADPYDPNVWVANRSAPSGNRPAWNAYRNGAPRVASHANAEVIPAPIASEDVTYEMGGHEMHGGEMHGHGGGCSSCGGGGGGCSDGSCGSDCGGECGGECDQCVRYAVCRPTKIGHVQLFGGTHGFKNPRDFGQNGNFGFQEGFNLSGPCGFFTCHNVGWQVGFQTTQSNLSGTVDTDDIRRQYFVTGGLFSRKEVGLNLGAVWDWYHDDYFIGDQSSAIELNQVRALASIRNAKGHEIGFQAAIGTDEADDILGLVWTPVDQYLAFYKWQFDQGADFRIFGGLTGEGCGIIGSDAQVPLNDSFSLSANWTYLIPEDGRGLDGVLEEQWNLSINLVWHWRCDARRSACSLDRPMFNVANNGYFLLRQAPE